MLERLLKWLLIGCKVTENILHIVKVDRRTYTHVEWHICQCTWHCGMQEWGGMGMSLRVEFGVHTRGLQGHPGHCTIGNVSDANLESTKW